MIQTKAEGIYDGTVAETLNQEYYDYSDFSNCGLWHDGIKTQKAACENLMEELLAFVTKKTGNILDAACGMGATTRYLLKYYKPEKVMGINASEEQLDACKKNALRCKFLLISPTKLDFKNITFDTIICIESAFRFNTRKKFFEEAYRVLKPGGTFVLSDILMSRLLFKLGKTISEENFLPDIESYQALLNDIGFRKVTIRDETHACWGGMYYNRGRFLREKLQQRELNPFSFKKAMSRLFFLHKNILNYILVAATKPK